MPEKADKLFMFTLQSYYRNYPRGLLLPPLELQLQNFQKVYIRIHLLELPLEEKTIEAKRIGSVLYSCICLVLCNESLNIMLLFN